MTIAVIGGGVTGITTALLLRLCDMPVTLYTRGRPDDPHERIERSPQFASLHAAASILPHSVDSERAPYWTAVSQKFLRTLAFVGRYGVREQTHYEIFEQETALPSYWRTLHNFEQLDQPTLASRGVPRRSRAEYTSGWRFDVMFCEGPVYLAALYELFLAAGGRVEREPSPPADIATYLSLDHEIFVNCTGQWAGKFLAIDYLDDLDDRPDSKNFEPLHDNHKPKYLRGHYLQVDIKRHFMDGRGRFFSYNYTPVADEYGTSSGKPSDVYCYPRSDSWLLGGSRQLYEGPIDAADEWPGEQTTVAEDSFTDARGRLVRIPAPILNLNSDLLFGMTGGELDLHELRRRRPERFRAGIGFRFQRGGSDSSVRIACSRVYAPAAKYVLHNYGHGGSGFALSWGCALDILARLNALTGTPPGTPTSVDRHPFPEGANPTIMLLKDLALSLLSEQRS